MLCRITDQPLENCRAEIERSLLHSAAGALCTFTGVVREYGDLRDVTHLEYEAYSEMATLRMAAISDQIEARWPGSRVAMIHRVGRLAVGEAAVLVSVSTPHRAEAFAACCYGIDELKTSVPIWKKEISRSGAKWV